MSYNDAYSPEQIALLVNNIGIKKANQPFLQMLTLGILAGAFIAFGAMFYTATITGSTLGLGPTRLLGGMAFSLGLVLVVVAGAELFTGNNLIVIAWAQKKISTRQLLRDWTVVYIGNFIGAVASAVILDLSGALNISDGAVMSTAVNIGQQKVALTITELFFRGILCNALVCLAVWLCVAAHTVSGKILAILFPISAFVALGFEHSIANMYLISIAMLQGYSGITLTGFFYNLSVVTAGNIIGGSVFVALIYWLCYLRNAGEPS